MPLTNLSIANKYDWLFAVPMFVVSLAFLAITAGLLHLSEGDFTSTSADVCLILLGLLYPAFIAETVVHWLNGSQRMKQHVWYLLCPILRLVGRDHISGTHVWLPVLGFREKSPTLERRLARDFSKPMIVIALMVLPIVAMELFWYKTVDSNPTMRLGIRIVESVIWTAFVFEFVVMISLVEKKLRYCRQNWIDVAVILLPLIAFLRAARLGRLVKLNQLSRTARIYRLRGLAIRMWRAVVTLEVIDMLLKRDPEYRMEKLQEQIDEKKQELDWLHKQMHRWAEKAEKEQAEAASSTETVPSASDDGDAKETAAANEPRSRGAEPERAV